MRATQLPLFEGGNNETTRLDSSKGNAFNDPAFAVNKQLPIHRWVPWIAGFSRDFVCQAIHRYLSSPGVILDPFSGVGTTLVEAIALGHDAIGFEINPYAALACRIKTYASNFEAEQVYNQITRFQLFYQERSESNYTPKSTSPAGFKTRADFYSPKVLRKVLIFHDFIATIEDTIVQDLFRLAFAATMVRYSNYSYEPSLGRRVSAGKKDIIDFAVGEAIFEKLQDMFEDIVYAQRQAGRKPSQAKIINDSFFFHQKYVNDSSVDLIITSPPYLNNYHYNRNTRPHLYWLGFATNPQDLKHLEEANVGTYWQTMRELSRVDLEFSLPNSDLNERLQEIRFRNNSRGIYGGNGWANYAARYFNDCERFLKGVHTVLNTQGTALVVVGNSIIQGVLLPIDKYIGEIARTVGLELVHIDIPRTTRVGNSIIQSNVRVEKAIDEQQLYEAVVVLRKS